MRLPGPFTRGDFDSLLSAALEGMTLTDHGAPPEVVAALERIIELVDDPGQGAAIAAVLELRPTPELELRDLDDFGLDELRRR